MVSRQGAAVLFSCTFSLLCFGWWFPRMSKSKVTREQHPRRIETVVIPPISRKEVNFKHVSRQERRKVQIRGVRI